MRALWSDKKNCSHNVFPTFKSIKLTSETLKMLCYRCRETLDTVTERLILYMREIGTICQIGVFGQEMLHFGGVLKGSFSSIGCYNNSECPFQILSHVRPKQVSKRHGPKYSQIPCLDTKIHSTFSQQKSRPPQSLWAQKMHRFQVKPAI